MENLDKAIFIELFVDKGIGPYYERTVNAGFVSTLWIVFFTLFFFSIKLFRSSSTRAQKIDSIVFVILCIAMWTSSSIVIFLEFQKPAPSAGFSIGSAIGFVIGTLLMCPPLMANQQTTITNTESKSPIDSKSLNTDIHNEKIKLKSNFYNAISLALIGTAFIAPISNLVTQPNQNPFNTTTVVLISSGLFLAILLHLLARHALNDLVKEHKTTKRLR